MTFEPHTGFVDAIEACESASAPVSAMWTRFASPPFTAAEERVLALAATDTLASLEPPGALDRLAALFFGARTAGRMLADPRLEALRRAAVVARHRHHLPDAEAARLRGVGYGEAQVRAVECRAA